jgi:hypothetical protein
VITRFTSEDETFVIEDDEAGCLVVKEGGRKIAEVKYTSGSVALWAIRFGTALGFVDGILWERERDKDD